MKRKITLIILSIALAITMSGCEKRQCKNCNQQGTPYPTLSPAEMP